MNNTPASKPNGIREDIAEIKQTLKCVEQLLNNFRLEYTREHERVSNVATRALDQALLNEKEIEEIRNQIAPIATWAKIVGAIASILIGLIVVLLWNLAINGWSIIQP